MRPKTHCCYCGNPLTRKHWEDRLRLFCEHCRQPIYENPIPATCVVVTDANRRLMLVRRSVAPKIGHWCLPGGFMELGETPREAALRELTEETGIAGRIDRLLGVLSNPSDQYHTVLMVGYRVRSYSGSPIPGDDASEVRWFAGGDLPEIAFSSHRKFVEMVYHQR